MSKKKIIGCIVTGVSAGTVITAKVMENKAKKSTYRAEIINPVNPRRIGFYEKYIKRAIDIVCAMGAIVVFSPLYLGVAFLVRIKLGSPVLFTQDRPGLVGKDGKETVFKMYKFRSMTDEKDENGELLPDEVRLTKFGKWLRNTSLDELPEAFNILNGTMSVIGPRPQLVRDMVFMNDKQRMRHTAKPGLSGLAQVNGRNAISWEDKIDWDLKYIENVNFLGDLKIICSTVKKAFIKQEGITQADMATAEDLGDYLLRTEKVNMEDYEKKQIEAKKILNNTRVGNETERIERVDPPAEQQKYSVLMSLYKKENPEYLRLAIDSMLNQTVPPDEIVLVEDGPLTDELYAVLDEYPMLRRIKNKTNMGLGLALNIGLKECRNELVARMDTDDISLPERCEIQIEFLNLHQNISIVGGQINEFIGEIANVVGRREVPTEDIQLKKFLRKRCPFNHMTVMFRKTAVLEAGNYQECFWNEDYNLWIRMSLEGKKFANVPETLVIVRVGADMYQRRGGKKYFVSEKNIQKLMLKNGIIGYIRYGINLSERFIVQILMPNWLRGIIFRKIARKKAV